MSSPRPYLFLAIPALLVSQLGPVRVTYGQASTPVPGVAKASTALQSGEPLLAASPSTLGFAAAILLLLIALVCFLRAQKREFGAFRTPLLLTSIASLLTSVVLLGVAAETGADLRSISIIPPSPLLQDILDAALGTLACAIVAAQMYLQSKGRDPARSSGLRRTLLALGLLGALALLNWGTFTTSGLSNHTEMFTRFMGSKYRREIGSYSLYDCTVKALSQSRIYSGDFKYPSLRDPDSGEVVAATARLSSINKCPERFSTQRWMEFVSDTAFFDSYLGSTALDIALLGAGYNVTPTSSMIASLVTNHGPPSPPMLDMLALIDPILLLITSVCVAWAFNVDTLCFFLGFLGIFRPEHGPHLLGSLLSLDWFAASVVALCLLRRGYVSLAGFMVGIASLLRVFPGILFAGALFLFAAHYITTQKFRSEAIRFLSAGFLGLVSFGSLTWLTSGNAISSPFDLLGPESVFHSPRVENIGSAPLLSFRPKEALARRPEPQPTPVLPFLTPPTATARPSAIEVRPPPAPIGLVVIILAAFASTATWCLWRERGLLPLTVLSVTALPFLGGLPSSAFALLAAIAFVATQDQRLLLLLFGAAVGTNIINLASDSALLSYPALSLLVGYLCLEVLLTYRLSLLQRDSQGRAPGTAPRQAPPQLRR